jgi:hypothetical protein
MTRTKAVEMVLKALTAIKPPSGEWLSHAVYTSGLILREAGVPREKAEEFALRWVEEAKRRGIRVRRRKGASWIRNAYRRAQDKPSRHWYRLLTGEDPPGGDFWVDLPPSPELVRSLKASMEKKRGKGRGSRDVQKRRKEGKQEGQNG